MTLKRFRFIPPINVLEQTAAPGTAKNYHIQSQRSLYVARVACDAKGTPRDIESGIGIENKARLYIDIENEPSGRCIGHVEDTRSCIFFFPFLLHSTPNV